MKFDKMSSKYYSPIYSSETQRSTKCKNKDTAVGNISVKQKGYDIESLTFTDLDSKPNLEVGLYKDFRGNTVMSTLNNGTDDDPNNYMELVIGGRDNVGPRAEQVKSIISGDEGYSSVDYLHSEKFGYILVAQKPNGEQTLFNPNYHG